MSPLRLNVPTCRACRRPSGCGPRSFEPLSKLPAGRPAGLDGRPAAPRPAAVGRRSTDPSGSRRRRPARRAASCAPACPNATPAQHEEILQRAGRSFEELRTLTLLAEIRDPDGRRRLTSERSMTQLAKLVDAGGDDRLRGSSRRWRSSRSRSSRRSRARVGRLRGPGGRRVRTLSNLEGRSSTRPGQRSSTTTCAASRASSPGRCASGSQEGHRGVPRACTAAPPTSSRRRREDPQGETPARYLALPLRGRDWEGLTSWMHAAACRRRSCGASGPPRPRSCRRDRGWSGLAQQVAAHYVKLGTFQHPDVRDAFAVMAASETSTFACGRSCERTEGLIAARPLRPGGGAAGRPARSRATRCSWPRPPWPARASNAGAATSSASGPGAREAPRRCGGADRAPETDAVRVKASLGRASWPRTSASSRRRSPTSTPSRGPTTSTPPGSRSSAATSSCGSATSTAPSRRWTTAVTLAQRSDALVTEQTRYLARRGTVHRRRGDLDRAAATSRPARGAVGAREEGGRRDAADEADRDFWLARVEDEAGLLLAGVGPLRRRDAGLRARPGALPRYADTSTASTPPTGSCAAARLALAYGCRGVGQPFRRPFAITAALDGSAPTCARRATDREVLRHIEAADDGMGLGTLARDTLLAANLFAADGHRALAARRTPRWRVRATLPARPGPRARGRRALRLGRPRPRRTPRGPARAAQRGAGRGRGTRGARRPRAARLADTRSTPSPPSTAATSPWPPARSRAARRPELAPVPHGVAAAVRRRGRGARLDAWARRRG
jgi:hypothetical protein